MGSSASSARSAQACRQCGSRAATAATASRRRSGREGPGRVERGGQLRVERVEDGLGAPGGELDCMFGGHPAMLRAPIGARAQRGPPGQRSSAECRAEESRQYSSRRVDARPQADVIPEPSRAARTASPRRGSWRTCCAASSACRSARPRRPTETAAADGAVWPRWPTSSRRTCPPDPLPRFIPPDEDGPPEGRAARWRHAL